MFGIGMTEMIIIAVVALIFIGPDQIPEVAKTVGKLINDLKRSTEDLKRDLHQQTGLPKNFDEWLETRKEPNIQSIAPPASPGADQQGSNESFIEDNIDDVQVSGSNGFGHDHENQPTSVDDDSENQTSMNLDADSSKDPKKS